MGNIGSSGSSNRRRHSGGGGSGRRIHPPPPPPPPVTPQPEITANRFVFPAAATPYHNYPGYYPPPIPLPAPYDHHHRTAVEPMWGRYPPAVPPPPPAPYVEYQKVVTIRNDVNIKKETLRIEVDEENPGKFLVSFTFDATVSGSITILFFAKEGEDCILTPMKENFLPPVTVSFQQGLGQKFRQPAGTGIDFSLFEESELLKVGEGDVYPLAVKADASTRDHDGLNDAPPSHDAVKADASTRDHNGLNEAPPSHDVSNEAPPSHDVSYEAPPSRDVSDEAPPSHDVSDEAPPSHDVSDEAPASHDVLNETLASHGGSNEPPTSHGGSNETMTSGCTNSQITQAVFEKEKGEFRVKPVKQILWVNGMRYELQEIYGIGNSVERDLDENDLGKECVICLSEPRDTTVLPCRHMCMCSGCAKVLRFQTNRCPICRQPVERLLEIKGGPVPEE